MANREVEKAQHAHPEGETLFEKIINKEIPAEFVYEDEQCVVFHDVNPQAPTHLLVVPRKPIPQLSKADDGDQDLLGHLLITARNVALGKGFDRTGFRLVINDGRHGAQSVYHLHVHILAGRQMKWPPG
ncbi:histidine triad nucleotide-binding protein 1-like [Spodoptera litura]|uniref:Histidine triad nucleotide-binding protein 1-like n=1 Tax=Spodoptera litura TaxID=69820 RepID=A0A9J7DVC0_SPOLT|nr:histidine triad nucleotide-binding protein 1-like [Spodoptera litura]